jgi:hypothetical protein
MAGFMNKALNAIKNFGASVTTVDNAKDPTSAYSMMKRKQDSMGSAKNFPPLKGRGAALKKLK